MLSILIMNHMIDHENYVCILLVITVYPRFIPMSMWPSLPIRYHARRCSAALRAIAARQSWLRRGGEALRQRRQAVVLPWGSETVGDLMGF